MRCRRGCTAKAANATNWCASPPDVTATRLKIIKRIRKGWHAWSPKAVGQEPVTIAILPGSAFEIAGDVVWSDGEQLRVAITCTVCDETPCQPPRSVVLAR